MRKFMLSMWLGLSLLVATVGAVDAAALVDDAAPPSAPAGGPADSRRLLLAALKASDAAALIIAVHGESGLRDFLEAGGDETSASIADKIAAQSDNRSEQEFARIWSTLAQKDGVARLSDELYPLWQAQLPTTLANAQMALTAMGAAVAEDASMTALERSQLIELQWALTGWMARTDFADRKSFEQLLSIARDWIVSSGAQHPLELALTQPERRLQLADQGMRSVKRALAVYGLDADAILGSVRIEEIRQDEKHARLRTSLTVFDVPLVFEENLAWHDGSWVDAAQAEALQDTESEAFDALQDDVNDVAAAEN